MQFFVAYTMLFRVIWNLAYVFMHSFVAVGGACRCVSWIYLTRSYLPLNAFATFEDVLVSHMCGCWRK